MLGKLRGFSKSKLAGVLVGIIIIPFVFWGMGSVFSGGNTNNVAKIDNISISTQDYVDHINQSGLNADYIKENIDNNILEEFLSELISKVILDMEINNFEITMTNEDLVKIIKSNKNFFGDDNKFSRLKYEKFLLERNISAPIFEAKLKDRETKKILFDYIGGGIKSPYFLVDKLYINENKKVKINYIDLEKVYDLSISDKDVDNFINENRENLKNEFLDISYTKITPKSLLDINDFNNEFFKIIDQIDNAILNEKNIDEISREFDLKLVNREKLSEYDEDEISKVVLKNKDKDKIQLIDKNDYFLLFEIRKVERILSNKNNKKFVDKIKNTIVLKKKFEFNKSLYQKIQDKKFNNYEFNKLVKENVIDHKQIASINDTDFFDSNSIKMIYSLPKNSFIIVNDKGNNLYLAKISDIITDNLNQDDENKNYTTKTNSNIINDIYKSYDNLVTKKYKVKIFNNSIDRVKEYLS